MEIIDLKAFTQELVRGSFTALAGIIAAYVGLRFFFIQKEFEIAKQRYLEESIDHLCNEIEAAQAIYQYNWSSALYALKKFRDIPEKIETSELSSLFKAPLEQKMNLVAGLRIEQLTGSKSFLFAYQAAIAFYSTQNNFVSSEIPGAIKEKKSGELIDMDHSDFINKVHQKLVDSHKKSETHGEIIEVLQKLGTELERLKLSNKKIHKFKRKRKVKKLVSEFEDYCLKNLGWQKQ